MMTYIRTLPDYFMIKQQDTPGNSELTTLYNNITGGLDCAHMLKIMCVVAVFVNNLKSTDPPPDPLTFLLRGLYQHGRLQTAQWTLSQTYHQSMDLIPFWSW